MVTCNAQHAADLIAGSGLDLADVAEAVGLAPESLRRDTNAHLDLVDYFRIRTYIMARLQDETCHLSSRQLLPGSTEFVRQHLPAQGTLTDAMETVATTYNMLHGGDFNRVSLGEGSSVISVDDSEFPYSEGLSQEQKFFAMETTLIFLHALLSIVAPVQAVCGLSEVHVKRGEDPSHVPHLGFWPIPATSGAAQYELHYIEPYTTTTIRFRRNGENVDDQIARLLGVGPSDIQSALAENVANLIQAGLLDQETVASALATSPATLRRRLAEERTSFREIRRVVLDREAKQLLSGGTPPTQVAAELGFSDVRSFNRAFTAWNGVTPKRFLTQSVR